MKPIGYFVPLPLADLKTLEQILGNLPASKKLALIQWLAQSVEHDIRDPRGSA